MDLIRILTKHGLFHIPPLGNCDIAFAVAWGVWMHFLFVVLLIGPLFTALAAINKSRVVSTTEGLVQGYVDSNRSFVFKGIPYAAPPVGPLRWKKPQPPTKRPQLFLATAFGNKCPQINYGGKGFIGDEDCLSLNIWTPRIQESSLFPVLVYLHGGANQDGSSADRSLGQDSYDGTFLSSKGPAVVVTINYRLGLLGFAAHRALSDEFGVSGNYGILDQLAALKWIQKNISAFGGDPKKITVFGQSAGAVDTLILLTSPSAKGLFSRAILHSTEKGMLPRLKDMESIGETMIRRLGVNPHGDPKKVATRIRSKSTADVIKAVGANVYPATGEALWAGPNIDGKTIPDYPFKTLKSGKHNHMPIIFSTTSEEFNTALYVMTSSQVSSKAEFEKVVEDSFGVVAKPYILQMYPVEDYASPRATAVAMFTDWMHNYGARELAQAAVGNQSEPVWRFVFDYKYASGPLAQAGAGHWVDTTMIFQAFRFEGYNPTRLDMERSNQMIKMWTRFAESGNPNPQGQALWTRYNPQTDPYLLFGRTISKGLAHRKNQVDFWFNILGQQ